MSCVLPSWRTHANSDRDVLQDVSTPNVLCAVALVPDLHPLLICYLHNYITMCIKSSLCISSGGTVACSKACVNQEISLGGDVIFVVLKKQN